MWKNRLSVIHPEHVIILAYFQMLHEETGNALSKYEDCTEKTKQNPEETKIRVKLKTCWFWQGAVLLLQ